LNGAHTEKLFPASSLYMGSEKLVLMAANVTETCGLPFMDIWVAVITHICTCMLTQHKETLGH